MHPATAISAKMHAMREEFLTTPNSQLQLTSISLITFPPKGKAFYNPAEFLWELQCLHHQQMGTLKHFFNLSGSMRSSLYGN